jgi:hypothetical protein
VDQAVECLLCKYEVLSSNPSLTKIKKQIYCSKHSLLQRERVIEAQLFQISHNDFWRYPKEKSAGLTLEDMQRNMNLSN